MIKTRLEFTLSDVMEYLDGNSPVAYSDDYVSLYEYLKITITPTIGVGFAYTYRAKEWLTKGGDEGTFNQNAVKCLLDLIYSRHREDTCSIINVDMSYFVDENTLKSRFLAKASDKFLSSLVQIVEESIDRFLPLFKMFHAKQSGDMIPKIESINISRMIFNDTPQTDDFTDFESPTYATNLTNSESRTAADSGSLISKLEEVRRYNASILHEWAKEFDGLFILNMEGENDEII